MRLVAIACSIVLLLAGMARGADSQTRVTIFAQSTVLGWNQLTTLFGTAQGAGAQDVVTIEARECGSGFFRTLLEAHVNTGGGWSADMGAWATTTFRARWRGAVSPGVTIRKRAGVALTRSRSGPGFVVAVTSKRSVWRRHVEIQRRSGGAWRTVRRVRLTDSVKSTGLVSASEARFRLAVPKGAVLRAVLPLAEARPCYVRSFSKVVRA